MELLPNLNGFWTEKSASALFFFWTSRQNRDIIAVDMVHFSIYNKNVIKMTRINLEKKYMVVL